jgi:cytochrome c
MRIPRAHPAPAARPILAGLVAGALAAAPASAQTEETGDPAAGKTVFEQCAQCHTLGDRPGVTNTGPALNGIMGRRAASVPEFNYSPQLRSSRITWDTAYLARFLKGPKNFIPGTRMLFNGLSNPKDVADVIAYMARFGADGAARP